MVRMDKKSFFIIKWLCQTGKVLIMYYFNDRKDLTLKSYFKMMI